MIFTTYVSSQGKPVGILTKDLNNNNFERIISKLGMENTYSPAGECLIIFGSFQCLFYWF